MVQSCPKCGTKDPDDKAVFCNKCGNRLPPRIPEKKDTTCPVCGTKIRDTQAVFCDKCGSPVHATAQVPVRHAEAPPAAARPVREKEHCPSCGAPLAEENMDYCNSCGVYLRGPDPRTTVPATPGENNQPYPEKTGPGADRPDEGKDSPVTKKRRRSLLKWALVSGVALIVLIIIAASMSGMIPKFNQSSNTTPSPTPETLITALPTRTTTQTTAPLVTPSPAEVPSTPVPTTVIPTSAPTTVTTNASATVTTNASATVTTTLTIASASQPLSVGQSAYDGKGTLTVHDFSFKDKMSDPVPSYAVGKHYLMVNITYENLQQNATMDVDLSLMKVTDGGGYPYEPVSDIMLENPYTGNSILPQEKRNGNLLFIVPPGATFLKLEYRSGTQNGATFQLT